MFAQNVGVCTFVFFVHISRLHTLDHPVINSDVHAVRTRYLA